MTVTRHRLVFSTAGLTELKDFLRIRAIYITTSRSQIFGQLNFSTVQQQTSGCWITQKNIF